MKRSFVFTVVLLLCAVAVSAGDAKFKDWEQSPESYFMTASEREQWKSVSTHEAAQTFINDFRARRGGESFITEVNKRAEMADRYLTIGKIKGSATLRGKLVILFGPPANIGIADREGRTNYAAGAAPLGVTDLGSGQSSVRDGDGGSQMLGAKAAGRVFRDYTFTFSSKTVPVLGGKDLVVVVETDAVTGKDNFANGTKEKDFESLFEALAKASIKN